MNPPHFWWRRPPGLAATALRPLSWAWGAITAKRMQQPASYWPPVPVICVGNFTVGGEGKTPTAIAVGELVRGLGLVPGFLSRGYGGSDSGPTLVGADSNPSRVGDESGLLSQIGPTVVSHQRPRGARLLVEQNVDVIVMDDGFQNPFLGKHLTLVATDAGAGLGNGLVVPAGPLRAPLRTQLQHADAIVLIGEGTAERELVRMAARAGKSLLRAQLQPVEAERWRDRQFVAFAAIGRPDKFFSALERAGAHFAGRNVFPDHHIYTEAEAATLLRHADAGDITLVTTEKDHARLAGATGVLAELRERTSVFAVRLRFDNPEMLRGMIAGTFDMAHAKHRGGGQRSAVDPASAR